MITFQTLLKSSIINNEFSTKLENNKTFIKAKNFSTSQTKKLKQQLVKASLNEIGIPFEVATQIQREFIKSRVGKAIAEVNLMEFSDEIDKQIFLIHKIQQEIYLLKQYSFIFKNQ